MGLINKIFGTHSDREIKHLEPIIQSVEALEEKYKAMSEEQLKGITTLLRKRLGDGESMDDILPDAFAAVREAADRVLGMRHYRVQLIGGIVLHQGRISEMKTGEGKTLVATLPVYLNALSGKGVHVVTVNDYLAKRDSEWMGKIYKYLGMSVGLIVHGINNTQRRESYACDITYGTNNEFGFDYLRDNMVIYKNDMVQRGHNYAIVDEVDSILVDEARTPLIISGMGDKSTDLYEKADNFVKRLSGFVVAETDDKTDFNDMTGESDYIVDEKAHTAVLTTKGIKKAEQFFGLDNLTDTDNYTIVHHINNALKAHGLMKLDQKYVVKDNEVIIVDDFTGRLMFGRRYSDGLHQAIEAKEHVKVERESKTLATITFQNYFRMYAKLSGMTGTALTEEDEFRAIYKLDVVSIPTNQPMIREDLPDAVYKTIKGKFKAVLDEVVAANKTGQPVLVGTISVDTSEFLSRMFTLNGIRHNVLNAKQHEREAEIVAQAGRFGAVTIATNMAGRGTDIILGGNPEFLAKQELKKLGYDEELINASTAHNETDDSVILEARARFTELNSKFKKETVLEHKTVVASGGLYIIGTERHESRRIDNQLRGRSGRQGDPGRSRFYLSLEDDLLRLFGGERMTNMFNMLGVDDTMQIEHKMLSDAIENAQKKIEGRNFGIRKNVLEYDDVMNKQRDTIYGQRRKVLEGEDLHPVYQNMVRNIMTDTMVTFTDQYQNSDEWDIEGLKARLFDLFGDLQGYRILDDAKRKNINKQDLTDELIVEALDKYENKIKEFDIPEMMAEAERVILLRAVDEKWMEHIDAMDDLRGSIGMRGYAQKDPVVEYKREGFEMFEAMNQSIQEDSVRMIMRGRFSVNNPLKRKAVADNMKEEKPESEPVQQMKASAGRPVPIQPKQNVPVKREAAKVGRNDPCPCGSGKKYKNCCGKDE
ncbi:MAG: preprotein translocase subunit SecA [Saccharofermentanales bacterium]